MLVYRWEARDEVRPAASRNARKCGVCVDDEMISEDGGGEAIYE